MGDIPHITAAMRQDIKIAVHRDWRDHQFLGRPVLPAVEAMRLLVAWMSGLAAGLQTRTMEQVRFAKFLEIDPAATALDVRCELAAQSADHWRAALLTRTASKSRAISRWIEHAGLTFSRRPEPARAWPIDRLSALSGICERIEPETIYRELVPFGSAFRSICSPLILSKDGALAWVRAPEPFGHPADPGLGSPFPLDGAFHAACVWGQRHAGVVAFPVGIAQRSVLDPTRPGETYLARIKPARVIAPKPGAAVILHFDLQIADSAGRIREAAFGVEMRDVSHGSWLPPPWISPAGHSRLQTSDLWPDSGVEWVIQERTAMAAVANLALSPAESARMSGMGAKRRLDYLSARLACKSLWRRLAQDEFTPASAIETVRTDSGLPMLPSANGHPCCYCSVSHDDRFAIAVAGRSQIGVDVEKITRRALQHREVFMQPGELNLKPASGIDAPEAALRIWSSKEAAAKAFRLSLADAWQQIHVQALDRTCSRLKYPNGSAGSAWHAKIEDHLFTLVTGPATD